MTAASVAPSSALAPFRRRAFRWLWLGVVVASVGAWAQMVGGQWLFVQDPNAAVIVPLVQTATTLPMMLLALPAGVLADAFDRRWLMFGVQVYVVVVASLLAVLTWLGIMPAALLLAFTFLMGAGMAVMAPVWQALITELVPRTELAAAIRLDGVSVNVARAVGPALAGLVIAIWGIPLVFALTAATAGFLGVLLVAWRRRPVTSGERDPFLPALVAGGRYVRNEPVVRDILIRLGCFIIPASAVWALLPLIANQQLGLSASGYGLLFAALGTGAVIGALTLGRVAQHVSSNRIVIWAAVGFALAFGLLASAVDFWAALPLLVLCGYAWTATVSTVMAEMQLYLPSWVRARAVAILLTVFLGSQALASPAWGFLTQRAGLSVAVLMAAALVLLSAAGGILWKIPNSQHLDRSPVAHWWPLFITLEPEPRTGPVVVIIEYDVADAQEADFLTAMEDLRLSRLRSGASRWELFRTGESPELFVELFQVPTWQDHLRQHEGRLTAEDQAIEQAALRHTLGQPRARHLLPPDTRRTSLHESYLSEGDTPPGRA